LQPFRIHHYVAAPLKGPQLRVGNKLESVGLGRVIDRTGKGEGGAGVLYREVNISRSELRRRGRGEGITHRCYRFYKNCAKLLKED
jgi:hypothetical protein